ncbi:unnamed protein product [Acanthoscelides obtectus]|nr:unnamed protein product [Acanthoscelides obtectus]CAK1638284.1 hypothetical protein AOBTE_LOCUS10505 [Acanthoscelides obtectus]
MGKTELADWLGKTVFRELAVDLNRSFEDDFTETVTNIFLNSTTYFHPDMGTLQAVVKGQAPSWTHMDTIMILAIGGLVLFFTGVCCKLCCTIIIRRRKRAKKAREERYPIRNHLENSHKT